MPRPRWSWNSTGTWLLPRTAQPLQIGSAAFFKIIQFAQRLIQIPSFCQERLTTLADIGNQKGQLAALAGRFVIHVDHVGDLVKSEPEPLAAQDELEPDAIAGVEDPSGALPLRSEKPAVLVKPDGAQRGVELLGKFANAPDSITHQALLPPSLDLTFT